MLSRHVLVAAGFILLKPLAAQDYPATLPEWKDPAVFEELQAPPGAFHVPFKDRESALLAEINGSPCYLSLNGLWDFYWAENPDQSPKGFYKQSYKPKNWAKLKVPSNWQMEGFGHPKFRNIALTFPKNPPDVPDDYNPTGCYRRTFKIPADWDDNQVLLRFDGVKSAFYLWINGQKAGYNEGAFEPSEFNITPYLKKGKNTIALKVLRYSTGSYLENQDMWRLSGIFRDVHLLALPEVHIRDFFHFTDLDDDYKDAVLHLEVDVANHTDEITAGYTLGLELLDPEGRTVLAQQNTATDLKVAAGDIKLFKLKFPVSAPALWSAEFPNLYQLLLSIRDPNGKIQEIFSSHVGFREVEMINNVFHINGVPVKLNGVNSHMHHPDHGQAVPVETLRKDLLLMKQFNINCVRTCHYPPSPVYLDLADELGMYVIDEVGDEAHSNIQLSYDSSFTEMYRDRARKLVHRDRNHPSVIMWSAGNEAGSGFNIGEVISTGKEIDPSRPAWMYGGNTFYIPYEDIVGPRYWTPFQLKNLAEGKILEENDLRPSFMDEYLAATGNGMGGTDEYWNEIWRSPRLIGGAIWDWISPGITTPLRWVHDASPHSNHGAIMGRPAFTNGFKGRGIKLTGHDDWVEFYRDQSLDITGKQLSISFHLRPERIEQPNTFLMKGNHQYGIRMSSPDTIEFYVQENNVNTVFQTPYYKPSSERISLKSVVPGNWYDNWHHVAAICDGSTMTLYIDTILLARRPFSSHIAHAPFPLCIGRDAESHDQGEYSGRLSSMCIDDLQITDSAFSPKELFEGIDPETTLLSLDFETDSHGDDFFAVGLGGRTYGVVWPDRKVQPELHQLRKSGQPVDVALIDKASRTFRITNRHHFKNLSLYTLHWFLLEDGMARDSGKMEMDLQPQTSTDIEIPVPSLKSPGELVLTISFRLNENTAWAQQGFEVAWNQFILQESMRPQNLPECGEISLSVKDGTLEITGESFSCNFSMHKGEILELKYNGRTMLTGGPKFNVWRAPLANDMDPWGAYIFEGGRKTPGLGRSIDNQLRTLGMRDLVVQCDSVYWHKGKDHLEVTFLKHYMSSNLRGAFDCRETYRIWGNGEIELDFQMIPESVMPEMLPKTGWQFIIPKEFSDFEWYGRGPFETYPDRKTGAKIGRYRSDVHKAYVPYIIPQDYGNHCDTREVSLKANDGKGIQITAGIPFNFSYHKYTTDNLSRAMYTYQLKEAEAWILNLDSQVSGVGGTAIRQLEQYRVKPAETHLRLFIKPVHNEN